MMLEDLMDLFVDELKDLYSAETQITKALPKMVKAATSKDLKLAFASHLQETEGHVRRLDHIFELLEKSPKGKTCKGMKGLLEEGSEMIKEDADPDVKDAGLISAAQRVEHYEMAGYGTVRTYAEILRRDDVAKILQETLQEEKSADTKLTKLAQQINVQAKSAAAA
ncbi:MAG TPA: ferritin-like domain-containing protein [Acidobacteriaceae bacterium]